MFMITRSSAWPQLHLASGAVACFHGDQMTLWPFSANQENHLSVQPLSGGGYGVMLSVGAAQASPMVIAHYPSRGLARRQLRRLAGNTGGRCSAGLTYGLLVAAFLFLVWFLFFLPVDLSVVSADRPSAADARAAARGHSRPLAPSVLAPPVAPQPPSPALIDDPAVPSAGPLTLPSEGVTAEPPSPLRR